MAYAREHKEDILEQTQVDDTANVYFNGSTRRIITEQRLIELYRERGYLPIKEYREQLKKRQAALPKPRQAPKKKGV